MLISEEESRETVDNEVGCDVMARFDPARTRWLRAATEIILRVTRPDDLTSSRPIWVVVEAGARKGTLRTAPGWLLPALRGCVLTLTSRGLGEHVGAVRDTLLTDLHWECEAFAAVVRAGLGQRREGSADVRLPPLAREWKHERAGPHDCGEGVRMLEPWVHPSEPI